MDTSPKAMAISVVVMGALTIGKWNLVQQMFHDSPIGTPIVALFCLLWMAAVFESVLARRVDWRTAGAAVCILVLIVASLNLGAWWGLLAILALRSLASSLIRWPTKLWKVLESVRSFRTYLIRSYHEMSSVDEADGQRERAP